MKRMLMGVMNGVAAILAAPFVIWARGGLLLFHTERGYSAAAAGLSLVPGDLGVYVRRAFYCFVLSEVHWDLAVQFGSMFTHPHARVGRRVWIGAYCLLGRCHLGDDVIIASRVSIPSGRRQHEFDDLHRPISGQGGTFEEVAIGADSWIGEGAIVMADVGSGVVVGAGSVVVKPVEPGVVVGGNPARVIGTRSADTG